MMYVPVPLDHLEDGDIIESLEPGKSRRRCVVIDVQKTLFPDMVDVRVIFIEGANKGKIKIFTRQDVVRRAKRWSIKVVV